MPKAAAPPPQEKDLHRWRLVEAFQRELAEVLAQRGGLAPGDTWADPRRTLGLGDYLGLHLFGLFNPVVKTLRGLTAASHLKRVQEEVCTVPVSLGSFSEAQAVVDPTLLEALFARLQAQAAPGEARCQGRTAPCGPCCHAWPGPSGAPSTAGKTRCACTSSSTSRAASPPGSN